MMTIRRSNERGHANHGWLDSHHTFSFASYYDPQNMGHRSLRVINDDRVISGAGFPTHGHRDMEIISYVVDGALAHKDSMGNGSVMRPGDVQRMTAGRGVTHSEFNHEQSPLRFLQIWVLPEKAGLEPGYEQKNFAKERNGKLRLVASRDGTEGSVTVHQDMRLWASVLEEGQSIAHDFGRFEHGWIQVVDGELSVTSADGQTAQLESGDGVALSELQGEGKKLSVKAKSRSEFLIFDLA